MRTLLDGLSHLLIRDKRSSTKPAAPACFTSLSGTPYVLQRLKEGVAPLTLEASMHAMRPDTTSEAQIYLLHEDGTCSVRPLGLEDGSIPNSWLEDTIAIQLKARSKRRAERSSLAGVVAKLKTFLQCIGLSSRR